MTIQYYRIFNAKHQTSINIITLASLTILLGILLTIAFAMLFDNLPQRLKYPLGTNMDTLIKELDKNTNIVKIYKGPMKPDDYHIEGYRIPNRIVYENETLVIIADGFIIYLYFDSRNILVHKEYCLS